MRYFALIFVEAFRLMLMQPGRYFTTYTGMSQRWMPIGLLLVTNLVWAWMMHLHPMVAVSEVAFYSALPPSWGIPLTLIAIASNGVFMGASMFDLRDLITSEVLGVWQLLAVAAFAARKAELLK